MSDEFALKSVQNLCYSIFVQGCTVRWGLDWPGPTGHSLRNAKSSRNGLTSYTHPAMNFDWRLTIQAEKGRRARDPEREAIFHIFAAVLLHRVISFYQIILQVTRKGFSHLWCLHRHSEAAGGVLVNKYWQKWSGLRMQELDERKQQ